MGIPQPEVSLREAAEALNRQLQEEASLFMQRVNLILGPESYDIVLQALRDVVEKKLPPETFQDVLREAFANARSEIYQTFLMLSTPR
jgi:hypothetical protein